MSEHDRKPRPLRIVYLEDNPLIVFHIEQMIEDLGHVFAGAFGSFAELQQRFDGIELDGALIDMDLADGPTGPLAAAWLCARGIPTIFVTGQKQAAAQHGDVSLGVVAKPVFPADLADKLELFRSHAPVPG